MAVLAAYALFLAGVIAAGFACEPGFLGRLLSAAIPWLFVLNMIPVMIYIERKGSALIQDRTGPERAFIPGLGIRLAGMVHNLADVVKLAMKEELIPRHVNRVLYVGAPVLSMFISLVVGAVIPYAHPIAFADGSSFRIQALDLNVGVLWVLAASGIGVYAVVLAGWASNNKFAQLGGLRASASMISYEITLGLAVVGALMVYGSASLNDMVDWQGGLALGFLPRWGVLVMPVGFLLFLIAAFAETNRTPFDLMEAESELVAGFHTEYGAFKFALFFMAEYVAIVVQCLLIVTLFFGGWQIPWVGHEVLSKPENAAFALKLVLFAAAAAGLLFGLLFLRWHRRNRLRWKDARAREGAVLAVLLGFGPAAAAVAALVIWGGALGPDGAAVTAAVLQVASLSLKTLFFCWLFVWVRWTVPRFRYDQLMALGWKVLIPLGIANLFLLGILIQIGVI